ncbi:hypothetical protein K3495_g10252 [Podosphaera aphanis]|nr:hypothetical protein K3495_g10252 [Podosphaera aphanis]
MEMMHSHTEMIDLNPLVEERHPIQPPANATAEEYHCMWYSLTDRIQYLPGGIMSGRVSYNVCFHNLVDGVQTHCYAPLGLNIKNKWTLCGSLPGEPAAPVEIGVGAPVSGLYIREDVDMTCNFMAISFVKKTLKKAHAILVERLVAKAQFTSSPDVNVYTDCDSASIESEDEHIEFGRDGQNKVDIRSHHIPPGLPLITRTSEQPEMCMVSQPIPSLYSPSRSWSSSPRSTRTLSSTPATPATYWKNLETRSRSPSITPVSPGYRNSFYEMKAQDRLSLSSLARNHWEWDREKENKRTEAFQRDTVQLHELYSTSVMEPVELEGSTPTYT